MQVKIKLDSKTVARVELPIDDIIEYAQVDLEDFQDYDYDDKQDIIEDWFSENIKFELVENDELPAEEVKSAVNSLKNWAGE